MPSTHHTSSEPTGPGRRRGWLRRPFQRALTTARLGPANLSSETYFLMMMIDLLVDGPLIAVRGRVQAQPLEAEQRRSLSYTAQTHGSGSIQPHGGSIKVGAWWEAGRVTAGDGVRSAANGEVWGQSGESDRTLCPVIEGREMGDGGGGYGSGACRVRVVRV